MEWDKYYLSTSGSIYYDVAGSIPILPIDLTPGLTQEATLVLQSHTTHSLLVTVRDAGTLGPLSGATVRLTKSGYDKSASTSIGYMRQTDWSGGSGQVSYTNQSKYYADNSNMEINLPAGDLKLKKVASVYQSPGWLESSTFDMGTSPTYRNIVFEPTSQPVSTSIKFQIATSNSSTPSSWNYLGSDGTANTYYTSTSTLINNIHNNQRYMRYKIFMDTTNTSKTPSLSELVFTYTNQCTPPGQVFFNSLTSGSYTLEVSKTGYDTVSDSIDISGNVSTVADMSSSE